MSPTQSVTYIYIYLYCLAYIYIHYYFYEINPARLQATVSFNPYMPVAIHRAIQLIHVAEYSIAYRQLIIRSSHIKYSI